MPKNRSKCASWTYMIAFLLLGTMGSMLFGGLNLFLEYRKSVTPGMSLDLTYLHFFTKEYIQRRYVGLVSEKLPQNSDLPSFRMFSDEQDLASLDANLPASGKLRYVSGHLQVDFPPFSSEVRFKYRGGLPFHWLHEKKSFRIKLPPYTTFSGARQFDLVNPSTIQTVTDWISYDIARSLGLLTPEYFPVRVYVNNKTNGLHYYLSRIDESFLRKNKRMPGSIYSGDTRNVTNPFGENVEGLSKIAFLDDDDLPLLWKDERLWDKGASRNAESKKDRKDIQTFIDIINESDPVKFMDSFESYFDKEKYYDFLALDTLVGSYHHDYFHNHKMYFDPYKGKFEPIEWDVRYWSSYIKAKDLPVYPLLKQIKLNPVLEYERDKVGYALWERFPADVINSKIDNANSVVRKELAADPVRHASDHRYGIFSVDKETPFSMKRYDDEIEVLKMTYRNRHDLVGAIYNNSEAAYTIKDAGINQVMLEVSVTGNSAIEFKPYELVPLKFRPQIGISRIFQNNSMLIGASESVRLYPGRKILPGNILKRSDSWAITAFGKERYYASPLHYKFLIKGVSLLTVNKIAELHGANTITGKLVSIKLASKLPSAEKTESVHPWLLELRSKSNPKNVLLSGKIDVTEDLVFHKDQTVKILPGTEFRFSKGKSLIFYGQVLAKGIDSRPIKFLQKVKGEPWGSVVVQGRAASGSVFRHIEVSGGSKTTQRLINYPGQFNIHDVNSFQIESCTIRENHIGDDALHVAYSKGEIKNCIFNETAFDALDIDISHVTVSGSKFYKIGNDAIDVMTSNITVHDVFVKDAGDKCISVGEESNIIIRKSELIKCTIGIAVKDQSKAVVEDIKFDKNKESAIALYRKNPRYGLGGEIDGNRLYGISENDIDVSPDSVNNISVEAYLPYPEAGGDANDRFVIGNKK